MNYIYGAFYDSPSPLLLSFKKKEQPAHSYKISPVVNHREIKNSFGTTSGFVNNRILYLCVNSSDTHNHLHISVFQNF